MPPSRQTCHMPNWEGGNPLGVPHSHAAHADRTWNFTASGLAQCPPSSTVPASRAGGSSNAAPSRPGKGLR